MCDFRSRRHTVLQRAACVQMRWESAAALALVCVSPDLLHSLLPDAATAECILRDEPLPDLHAGATSLSGLLRSGLGRLGVKVGRAEMGCR